MYKKAVTALLFVVCVCALCCVDASAQFKAPAFSQQYNNDTSTGKDSVDVLFSFKEYFSGLAHKEEIKIGTSFAGSLLVVGGQQIYNKQYWKLPIVYGGIGAGIAGGLYYGNQGKKDVSTWCYIGAGAFYWASLMDGIVCYKPSEYPHAGKATIYSILLPGLGQIYNHEVWKLPIYLGGMGFAVHMYTKNKTNFEKYQRIYKEATDAGSGYDGPVSAEQALYYKNVFRRYRDYSIVGILGVYLLQIIDANVFSYMHDFEVDEDLAIKVTPSVIIPEMQFASNAGSMPAFGFRMGLTF